MYAQKHQVNATVLDRAVLNHVIGYDPHKGQRAVIASPARFKVVCCGRRWGKSAFAGHELTYHMLNPADAGNVYWIVGPTYDLGEREFRVLHDDIMRTPYRDTCHITYNKQQGNMVIRRKDWGTTVEVKSAERPRGLQGEGLSGVVMAEAAEHNVEIWEQYVRPALADKRGWAIFPSTPKGFNYFCDFYNDGTDPNEPEWDSWRFPSWTNERVFSGPDDPEIESMRRRMSKMKFQQEICAEFTTFEGRVYSEFRQDVHVRQIRYMPHFKNYWTFDFGYTNPTVCLDVMVDPDDNIYVWREYYEPQRAYSDHCNALNFRENPAGFHVDGRFGDPADPGGMAEMAKLIGSIFPAKASWEEGVEAVKTALTIRYDENTGKYRPKLFVDPSCKNLIRQLSQLPVIESRIGSNDAKEGQKKKDDHAADALRYFFTAYFVLGVGQSFKPAFDAMQTGDQTASSAADKVLDLHPSTSASLEMLLDQHGGGNGANSGFFTLNGMEF